MACCFGKKKSHVSKTKDDTKNSVGTAGEGTECAIVSSVPEVKAQSSILNNEVKPVANNDPSQVETEETKILADVKLLNGDITSAGEVNQEEVKFKDNKIKHEESTHGKETSQTLDCELTAKHHVEDFQCQGNVFSEDPTMAFVSAYEEIINGSLAQYHGLSSKLGSEVKAQSDQVVAAFRAQLEFLKQAAKCKQPNDSELQAMLRPTSEKIMAVQDFREKNRASTSINHLSSIAESVPALGWVAMAPKPGPYVKEMLDASQFYSNRVLKDYKEKDQNHVEWTKAWTTTLNDLIAYIKQHHTTGVTWNKQGGAASPGGCPPPPPMGAMPPPPLDAPSGGGGVPSGHDNRSALFADLSKGGDVTKGLKKVAPDQMTHKNPALRAGATVPDPGPKASQPGTPAGPAGQAPKKPPRCELDGKKWIVEYQTNNHNIVIDNTEIKQTVYVYRCENSTIKVVGKVNSIVLDGCKKSGIVFDDVVSSIEFVNCQSVQAQVQGKCQTVSIDKTDGCMVYLSKDSVKAEIVSAKSSEMNILLPDANAGYIEYPLPEQYKHRFDGKKFNFEVAQ